MGFGTFEVGTRAAKQARNFKTKEIINKTKEIINVPAFKTVKFKIGKGLKESVK